MRKHIKVLAKPAAPGTEMEVLIIEQTHRCNQFGKNGYEFLSSNNMRLQSTSYIEYQAHRNHEFTTLAVLGYMKGSDRQTTKIPMVHFEAFKIAIEEYNSFEFA
jgi:hypothetical protein